MAKKWEDGMALTKRELLKEIRRAEAELALLDKVFHLLGDDVQEEKRESIEAQRGEMEGCIERLKSLLSAEWPKGE